MKSLLRRALEGIIGEWSWKAPPWMVSGRTRVRTATEWVRGHKRRALAVVALCAVIGTGSREGYRWWRARPRPVRFIMTAVSPAPMPMRDDAKPNDLQVVFDGSSARLEQIGKVVSRGIALTPSMPGEWKWTTDRILTFTPEKEWAVGQQYKVAVAKDLFPPHVLLEEYSTTFTTAPFKGSASGSFYEDPVSPRIKRVELTATFTHPVDTSDLPRHVTLELQQGNEKKPWEFTVTYDKFKGQAFIHSATVPIPTDDARMVLTISPGIRSARGGPGTTDPIETGVNVPGMYTYFHTDGVELTLVPNEKSEPEQVLVVTTSTGVTSTEMQQHLRVFLLPKDLPAAADHEAEKDYAWDRAGAEDIGDEQLQDRVTLQALPTDKEFATLHSFKLKVPVGRYLYARVTKGAQSAGGYVLAKDSDTVLQVPEYPKEVHILSEGSVLSLTGERKLSILARGVPGLWFEIGRILPSEVNHLVSQTSGSLARPSFDGWRFNADNISERFVEKRALEKTDASKAQYAAFDFGPYLQGNKHGLFMFHVRGYDPDTNKFVGDAEETRFVLVTDLGLVVKDTAAGEHCVFVVSLHDGVQVSGATVEVLGKNGLPLATGTTDESGQVRMPRLSDFTREKEPTVYVVHRGDDLSFLPYNRGNQELDFSRFDVGGVTTGTSGTRLTAYLFSDRGLYRPGDLFHVAAIVKPGDWNQVIAGVPLEVSITDPRGLEIQKQKIALNAAGFEEVSYQTEETSPTGSYTVSLYVVKDGKRMDRLSSTTVRVEEFMPDRLKIATHFSTERLEGWVSPTGLKGRVELRNLFGTPAENRRISATVTLVPAHPAFRQYKDYSFFDPLQNDRRHTLEDALDDVKTDAAGDVELELGLEKYEKATYMLTLTATGYEAEGGRGVTGASTMLVSPLPHLVGYKADGDLHYISKGSARSVSLIAIDPTLKKIALPGLKGKLLEERYLSVLTRQENGTYAYQSTLRELPVRNQALSIAEKGGTLSLPTDQPGDFVFSIADAEDTELTRIRYSVVGAANLTRSLEKNAELEIKLNKADYATGDDIEVQIKAPYTGAGLLSIERDQVYSFKWFKTSTTSAVEHIPLPPGIEGNAYINVAFVRAIDSPEIFMSPLSYGVAPFSISRARRMNPIAITTADIGKPGDPLRIKYRAEKPGKAVVFAVDEGILQVAHYRTPDPLAFFFEKKALQVDTRQILDQLLPEFSVVKAASSSGGDEAAAALGKNLNPFKRKRDKPVVYWSGIVDVDTTDRTLTYTVPESFNGTLRVMAVAVSPDSLGVSTKNTIIRGPFVISPNVPAFATPGDEVEVSAGVSNGVEGSGKDAKVTLQLQISNQLDVLDGASRTLSIPEGHETSAVFRLRVKRQLGDASLTFTASLGGQRSKQSVDLSVRPATPYMTTLTGGVLQHSVLGASVDVPISRKMFPEYRTLEASTSPLPLGLAHGLMQFLVKVPYGCTEQIVSQALPALVLRNRPDFGFKPAEVEANLSRVLRILRARQNGEGAFGYWAGNSYVKDFVDVYAMQFLTEARDRGYPVPPELLAHGLTYLKGLAERDASELPQARVRAFAIYVLTRNGIVTTRYLTPFREQLDGGQLPWKEDATAVYLAGTYKLLKQDGQALKLIEKAGPGNAQVDDYSNFYDGPIYDATYLSIVTRQFPELVRTLRPDAVQHLTDAISHGSSNTLSAALEILALDSYASAVGNGQGAKALGATVAELASDGKPTLLTIPDGLFPRIELSDSAAQVRFGSRADVPLFYGLTLGGFDTEPPAQPILDHLEVQRELETKDGKAITQVKLGSEIDVHVKVRATDKSTFDHVAIVDLLPAGFEVVLNPPPPEEEHPHEVPAGDDAQTDENDESQPSEGDESAEAPDSEADTGDSPSDAVSDWVSPIGTDDSTWSPEYADIREDRVILYGSVGTVAKEFIYRIRATNAGTFVMPPPFAESMYDPHVRARGIASQVTVQNP